MHKQIKNLLRIIRFTPVVVILIISSFIIIFLINEQKNEILEQKNNIEKQFMQDEKERIKLIMYIK